ncbi:MAG: response regulator transcription factor [Arcobacteraceae bacterium]|nr:response regulator transcription factor [Arcobacteraceae bacterium]
MIKNNILLVEDDADIIIWIESYLEEFGYKVTSVDTVTDALSHIKQKNYDIVILDINLPDFLGYEVLKYIQENDILLPVIIISAYSDKKTKLHTFKLGASDYMVKPLDLEELEARISVHLRRKEPKRTIPTTFSIEENQIIFKNQPLKLTKIEYHLLKTLIDNKNNVIEREKLCEYLSSISSIRSLDYHIRNIRKKLDDNISHPHYLITEYGVGYKLIS